METLGVGVVFCGLERDWKLRTNFVQTITNSIKDKKVVNLKKETMAELPVLAGIMGGGRGGSIWTETLGLGPTAPEVSS